MPCCHLGVNLHVDLQALAPDCDAGRLSLPVSLTPEAEGQGKWSGHIPLAPPAFRSASESCGLEMHSGRSGRGMPGSGTGRLALTPSPTAVAECHLHGGARAAECQVPSSPVALVRDVLLSKAIQSEC